MNIKELVASLVKSRNLKQPRTISGSVEYICRPSKDGEDDKAPLDIDINYDSELTIYTSSKDIEHTDHDKGGIVVLRSNIDRMKIGNLNIVDFINEHITSILTHMGVKAKWSIGYYMNGLFRDSRGIVFDGDSLCIELLGPTDNQLLVFSQILCDSLNQYGLLIKSYEQSAILYLSSSKDTISIGTPT